MNDHIEKKIRFRNVQIKVSLAFKRRRSLRGLLIFPRGVITVADQCDIAPFYGDWSQSEKLSEIKPPLKNHSVSKPKNISMKLQIQAEFGPTLGR